MGTILSHLSTSTPTTVNALMKLTGLTATGVTLALVELGGTVEVKDGGIVLKGRVPEAGSRQLMVGFVGRRPRTEREQELHVCRELIIDTVRNTGSCSGPSLHRATGFSVDYRNIHRAARELIESGTLVETRQGRLRVWTAPSPSDLPESEFEVLGG